MKYFFLLNGLLAEAERNPIRDRAALPTEPFYNTQEITLYH